MFDMIRYRRASESWQKEYNALAPKIGEVAPDFQLLDVDGGNPVRLSDLRGQKPVALIFGSYT